jgi:hypothetical protein
MIASSFEDLFVQVCRGDIDGGSSTRGQPGSRFGLLAKQIKTSPRSGDDRAARSGA